MFKITAVLACSLAAAPVVAQQRTCISAAENEAVIGNLLPSILAAAADRCVERIGPGAYLASAGQRLAAGLQGHADASWPVAKQALERVGGNALPDNEALLGAGRALIAGGIANGMDADACRTVSRLTEKLAPLPPENFAGVFALFLELGISENAEVPFKVCRAEKS